MEIDGELLARGRADASEWLRDRRARRVDARPRRRGAVVAVALLHLLLFFALRGAMGPRFDGTSADAPLVVRFDTPEAERDDPALRVAPPRRAVAEPRPVATPRDIPARRTTAGPTPPTAIAPREPARMQLFERDGSLPLSREVIEAAEPAPAAEPDFREGPRRTRVWRADKPAIVHAPTRFERYWKPDQENLAQELVRKYPALGLVIQNAGGHDRCPPRSIDPDCENLAQPTFPDDPTPDNESLR